jgi:hypothetical protein
VANNNEKPVSRLYVRSIMPEVGELSQNGQMSGQRSELALRVTIYGILLPIFRE